MEGFGNMTDTDFAGEMSSEDRARWPAPALSPTSASSPPGSWGAYAGQSRPSRAAGPGNHGPDPRPQPRPTAPGFVTRQSQPAFLAMNTAPLSARTSPGTRSGRQRRTPVRPVLRHHPQRRRTVHLGRHRLSRSVPDGEYGQECHPGVVGGLSAAWQVTLIDPVRGRNDVLWPVLKACVAST